MGIFISDGKLHYSLNINAIKCIQISIFIKNTKMSKIPKTLRAHCARNIRFQGKIFWEVHFIIEPSHISNEHKILRTQQLELPGSYKKSLL